MQVIFLGMNSAGEDILAWLKNKGDVSVEAVVKDRDGLEKIQEVRPELVVSSGFEHKVPQEIIDIPEKGVVNLHPSYLPYNRGAHPYIWPIIEDTPAGVSIHFMNKELDKGPVIARKKVKKQPSDDAKDLRTRLMREQADLFKENWQKIISGEAFKQSQGTTHSTDDLDEVSELDLEQEMTLREAIDLLRGLTYGEKKLAHFEKDGKRYNVGLKIEED